MLGFQIPLQFKKILFAIFFVTYVFTVSANTLIIVVSSICQQLSRPMYFFLSNWSVCEIILTTNIVPNMLYLLTVDQGIVSVTECFLQFYMFGTSATTACFLLAVMSYDRYLAICSPLHYSSIINERLCIILAAIVWTTGIMATVGTLILMSSLQFCKSDGIDHFFCDREPILSLSCSDTTKVKVEALIFSFCITLLPFFIIVWSYFSILRTIFKMITSKERHKTFSTCSSHLIVVSMYYGTLIIMYVVPSNNHSFNFNKLLSLLYIVVTPLLNPIIYSFKNRELRSVLQQCIHKLSICATY